MMNPAESGPNSSTIANWSATSAFWEVPLSTCPVSRPSGRATDALRPIVLEPGVSKYAEGSCLAKFGDTHVLCTASVEERVPPWLRGQNRGWVTAEYGMLPRSTLTRTDREAARGRQTGRTQEIQRLIGRSLRAAVDLTALGPRQIRIDCDVVQADGGTRTAAVTGGWVALRQAVAALGDRLEEGAAPLTAATWKERVVLDLDYAEDQHAAADANFVFAADGGIVEVQGTAEEAPFSMEAFQTMLGFARGGAEELFAAQRAALGT